MEKIGGRVQIRISGLYGTEKTIARVDTGAKYVSIDYSLASRIGAGPVVDVVKVSSPAASRLKKERRPVVPINLEIGKKCINCNATLSDRRSMKYDVIIGRDVLIKLGLLVDVNEFTEFDYESKEYNIKFVKVYSKLGSMVDNEKMITPAILSLEYGGNWSMKLNDDISISVVKRKLQNNVLIDIIYLIINPSIVECNGKLVKLDKCGDENIRAVGEYPNNVVIKSETNVMIKVNPKDKTIKIKEIDDILELNGVVSANFYHEYMHVKGDKIRYKDYITGFKVVD